MAGAPHFLDKGGTCVTGEEVAIDDHPSHCLSQPLEAFTPVSGSVVVQARSPPVTSEICPRYHIDDPKPCSACLGNANRTLECMVHVSGGIYIDEDVVERRRGVGLQLKPVSMAICTGERLG